MILCKRYQVGVPLEYKLLNGQSVFAKREADFIVIDVPDNLAAGFRAKYRFRYPVQSLRRSAPTGLTKKVEVKKSIPVAKKIVKRTTKSTKTTKKRKV